MGVVAAVKVVAAVEVMAAVEVGAAASVLGMVAEAAAAAAAVEAVAAVEEAASQTATVVVCPPSPHSTSPLLDSTGLHLLCTDCRGPGMCHPTTARKMQEGMQDQRCYLRTRTCRLARWRNNSSRLRSRTHCRWPCKRHRTYTLSTGRRAPHSGRRRQTAHIPSCPPRQSQTRLQRRRTRIRSLGES